MAAAKMLDKRLVSLCLLGFALLNFPLLSLFDVSRLVWGIPLLYGYIFTVWTLLILLVRIAADAHPKA
ncbi:MAG: hypothetical protein WAU91_20670, partial [Desulfatitalea sp.]